MTDLFHIIIIVFCLIEINSCQQIECSNGKKTGLCIPNDNCENPNKLNFKCHGIPCPNGLVCCFPKKNKPPKKDCRVKITTKAPTTSLPDKATTTPEPTPSPTPSPTPTPAPAPTPAPCAQCEKAKNDLVKSLCEKLPKMPKSIKDIKKKYNDIVNVINKCLPKFKWDVVEIKIQDLKELEQLKQTDISKFTELTKEVLCEFLKLNQIYRDLSAKRQRNVLPLFLDCADQAKQLKSVFEELFDLHDDFDNNILDIGKCYMQFVVDSSCCD